ncbi:MAG: tetratricopeptide repeat protein [Myxococcaceae bacterium]|jgi:Flp pilus assembly protein TadD|nr:tetratricopeptide repeat protein [Myxococcaceae bacterium]
MKKQLVSAIAAALAFTACEDPPKKAVVLTPMPPTVVAKAPPVIPDLKPDSGVPLVKTEPAVVVDALALAHDTTTVDHLARARQLADERDFSGALTEARRSLFSSPGDVETLELIAKLGRQAGQPALSADAWGRIATQRATDAVPPIKQARAFLQAKDFAGAITAGKEAARRDPGNPEAFQVTGLAQLSSGDLSGAIASFKTVIGLQPDHGYAMNNLGLAYLRANRNDEAVEILEEAAEHLPTVAYVHNNLGVAYERVGRGEDAKVAYQDAMDLSPKYVKARLNAARVAKGTVELDGAPESDTLSDVPHPMPEP